MCEVSKQQHTQCLRKELAHKGLTKLATRTPTRTPTPGWLHKLAYSKNENTPLWSHVSLIILFLHWSTSKEGTFHKIWHCLLKTIRSFWKYLQYFNPFPHIDAFWRLCSRRIFKNIVTKEEIAQNKQFLLLPQCFQLLVIGYPFNYRDFVNCWQKMTLKLSK